ncbi:hypothetical protein A0H81_12426 [Grifola frondosa]|uniref:Uncharacterized protein n=1 Tax=Grifola frondosa TaxID=5627 RepID=A0A1C7LTQ7_GRIFR|nr:hypothetical protein A0H81_12426 [Grifola frondosa]
MLSPTNEKNNGASCTWATRCAMKTQRESDGLLADDSRFAWMLRSCARETGLAEMPATHRDDAPQKLQAVPMEKKKKCWTDANERSESANRGQKVRKCIAGGPCFVLGNGDLMRKRIDEYQRFVGWTKR